MAAVKLTRFLKREDFDEAYPEAIAHLKEAFGEKSASADEMLADLLHGSPLARKDSSGLNMFLSRLEETYYVALDTHRDEDFNRVSLIDRILNEKLPFFTDKWSTLRTKKGWKRPTFIDFLKFLKFQHRVTEYTEGTGHAAQKSAPQKPAVQAKVSGEHC